MFDNLKKYNIVLASKSPRRRLLLSGLGLDFQVRVIPDIAEDYPEGLPIAQIPVHIAEKKAEAYRATMDERDLIIAADTIVVVDGEVLGKPAGDEQAKQMLHKLSGRTHQVITGVCIFTRERKRLMYVPTEVDFKALTDDEIDYYVDNFHPIDKAGAYGIQEWIGLVGVMGIRGSYFNVMGLPVQRIYSELLLF